MLKTTDSEFHTFYCGALHHARATDDRIMATLGDRAVAAHRHRHRLGHLLRPRALGAGDTFAGHHSLALQQTLYAMGEDVIDGQPEIAEIRFSMPNKHHFVVDLSPFGLKNKTRSSTPTTGPTATSRAPSAATTPRTRVRRVRPGPGLVTAMARDRRGPRDRTGLDRHPVDEMLPPGPLLLYGLQHVMSMYAGVVAVPLIVGSALGLPFADLAYLLTAALLVSGLATLLQTLGIWRIGARLPLVQGTSFAAVASMLAIGKDAGGGVGGLQYIFGAVLVAGVIGFLLSGVFNRLLHFFPPVVTGSVITVIGISLLPVAIRWAAGGAHAPNFGAPANIGLAALTLADHPGDLPVPARLLQPHRHPGRPRRSATLVAAALGMTDFSRIGQAQWFAVSTPFHFGPPQFAVAAIISMTIVMLVIMTETTADILAIGEVVDRPADGRTVVGGLRADSLSTAVSGGLLNSFSGQRVRPERRAGGHHRHQEPLRGRGQRRDPGGARARSRRSARSSPRSRCRCSAAPAWRCSPPWPRAASGAEPGATTRATTTSSSSPCRSAWA